MGGSAASAVQAAGAACSGKRKGVSRPPNRAPAIADNLGPGDPSCCGGESPTPHVDAIAGGGVFFTDFFVSTPADALRKKLESFFSGI
ncbi:MAG: hypothetical protein V1794_07555 [Candidatus Glassbacteria bacterium]